MHGFRWFETKLKYHPQLERRLLGHCDCKVTICRENHWNVQRIQLTIVNITDFILT